MLRRKKGKKVVESDAGEAFKATRLKVVDSSIDDNRRLVLPPPLSGITIPLVTSPRRPR